MTITCNSTTRRPASGEGSLTEQLGLDPADTQIFDFANPGPDSAPEPKVVNLPTWPGYLAHVRWPHDGPILLIGSEVYGPDDAVDMRCGHCTATSVVALDDLERRIVFMIHHQRGCSAVDDLMALAGVL